MCENVASLYRFEDQVSGREWVFWKPEENLSLGWDSGTDFEKKAWKALQT